MRPVRVLVLLAAFPKLRNLGDYELLSSAMHGRVSLPLTADAGPASRRQSTSSSGSSGGGGGGEGTMVLQGADAPLLAMTALRPGHNITIASRP